MIFIGLGANLPSPVHGSPKATLQAALDGLHGDMVKITRQSQWYRSAPVPISDQPWYINGIAQIQTSLPPAELLARLAEIEADFGRVRIERNAARVIDLDLIAYHDFVSDPDDPVQVPHPRMAERAFVILPLAELAPEWRHPVTGQPIAEIREALPSDQQTEVDP